MTRLHLLLAWLVALPATCAEDGSAFTQEQFANGSDYLDEKLTVYFGFLDRNHDGYFTAEDFQLIADFVNGLSHANETEADDRKSYAAEMWNMISPEGTPLDFDAFRELVKAFTNKNYTSLVNEFVRLGMCLLGLSGCGGFDYHEYCIVYLMRDISPVSSDPNARIAFHGIDTNHDGIISEGEFAKTFMIFLTSTNKNDPANLLLGPV